MKIVIVMPSAHLHGGAEEAFLQLLRCRTDAKHNVDVVFLENGQLVAVTSKLVHSCLVVESGRMRQIINTIRVIVELRSIVTRLKPNIILSWMTKAHIYAGLAALCTNIPCCYFQMGLPDGGAIDRFSRIVPAVGALACSEFIAKEQSKYVSHTVIGVPLGADMARFGAAKVKNSTQMKEKLGFDPSQTLIGIVGRLQTWKGMHVYLSAMRDVVEKYPSCQGVIVGGTYEAEPGYLSFLESESKRLNLTENIRLVGSQTNVPEWMQAMDIVVHASDREPFGIVIVEAMSLGKAVVATKPGGPEEIIDNGKNGLLVNWNEPMQLSAAICCLLVDPPFANAIGRAALARSAEFSAENYSCRVIQGLKQLLSQ